MPRSRWDRLMLQHVITGLIQITLALVQIPDFAWHEIPLTQLQNFPHALRLL